MKKCHCNAERHFFLGREATRVLPRCRSIFRYWKAVATLMKRCGGYQDKLQNGSTENVRMKTYVHDIVAFAANSEFLMRFVI